MSDLDYTSNDALNSLFFDVLAGDVTFDDYFGQSALARSIEPDELRDAARAVPESDYIQVVVVPA
ncbi:MAG: hypothetical protein R2705_19490 [Ilumatobacteraceae bacterium]